MKMVKKILLGTLAVAAILTFASCGQREEAGNSEMIDVDAGSKKASINYTNEGDSLARGFKTLQTDHLDAICHITNNVNIIETPTDSLKTNGVMGYIFNLVKNEDETYAFTIAGVRYNQKTGTIDAYVETFEDVEADKLESDLPTGTPASGETYADAFGFRLADRTTVDALLAQQKAAGKENQLDLWIDVVANDGKSVGRTGTAGTYTVTFYGADPQRTKKTSNGLEYKNTAAPKLATVVVAKDQVHKPFVKEGETEGKLDNMQADIGFYANVQKGQTLTGEWVFDAIRMEAEEIEE